MVVSHKVTGGRVEIPPQVKGVGRSPGELSALVCFKTEVLLYGRNETSKWPYCLGTRLANGHTAW